jgi:hypothetical protein
MTIVEKKLVSYPIQNILTIALWLKNCDTNGNIKN